MRLGKGHLGFITVAPLCLCMCGDFCGKSLQSKILRSFSEQPPPKDTCLCLGPYPTPVWSEFLVVGHGYLFFFLSLMWFYRVAMGENFCLWDKANRNYCSCVVGGGAERSAKGLAHREEHSQYAVSLVFQGTLYCPTPLLLPTCKEMVLSLVVLTWSVQESCSRGGALVPPARF